MQERRRIVDLWQRGAAAVLVTLVRVEGSSYRRPGARMLITAEGEYAGSISGGCLEAEVVRKSPWKVRGGAVVERYSTLFDDTAEIPYGLGCGGTVDLLLEPAGTPEFDALMEGMAASLRGETHHVVTQLPGCGRRLSRTVCDPGGRILFASPSHPVVGDAATSGQDLAENPDPGAEPAEPFDEWLEPPQRLFVFGAGDDAQPMVEMASLLGWGVYVVDGRRQWARAERFPQAGQVLAASPSPIPETLNPAARDPPASGPAALSPADLHSLATDPLAMLDIGPRDAAVVMTHSYEQDRAWLAALLPKRPRYLGLLGARHRSALLVSEVAAMLGWSVQRVCDGLFAPVGLDLGGDGAEAIALAIVAEIQTCCQGKLGLSRRMTPVAVAEQVAQGGALTLPAGAMRALSAAGAVRLSAASPVTQASGVAAVVLAAGFSRRLGRPKQTLTLEGESLVSRAARVARDAGLSPVIVVVNPEATFRKPRFSSKDALWS